MRRTRSTSRSPLPLLAALTILALPGAACATSGAQAVAITQDGKPSPRAQFNLDKKKLALQGYDPVSYFPEGGGEPRRGKPELTTTWEGVVYRFATEENEKLFLASPARFEPQYGGWCAYAMADGEKVSIDPESFLLTDGKLYLFYKSWLADTRARWLKDARNLQQKADAAWAKLIAPPKEGPR